MVSGKNTVKPETPETPFEGCTRKHPFFLAPGKGGEPKKKIHYVLKEDNPKTQFFEKHSILGVNSWSLFVKRDSVN